MHRKLSQKGFTLIEALVALLVTAFGMLAIAGFQITLSRNSDVAKQRTEATRLAQEKLEQLRAYPSLTSYVNQMVSSTNLTQEVIDTNTRFTRSWGVSAAGTVDTGRTVFVTVAWTDRAGAAEQIQLFSSVSASDPSEVGGLWFPLPDGTILRRPKDRSIDIPIPATTISGADQKSSLQWSGSSGGYLVFSNVSGDVVLKCTGGTAPTAADLLNSAVCGVFNGYVLTGYISGAQAASVTTIAFSGPFVGTGTPECSVGNATNQNDGSPLAGFRYYACLIQPTTTSPKTWSGRTDLTGPGSGTKTCRYTTNASTTDNNNHPTVYSNVDRSLDNQNFNVISSGNCPADTVLHKTN